MSVFESPDLADVFNASYVTTQIVATSVASEAKVGVTRLSKRQLILLTNTSSSIVYFGPSGVTTSTGVPLRKDELISLPFGENIAVFLICAPTESATVTVQEIS